MTAIDPRQCHPLIRYRRSVGLAASALCVVLYLTHALHWHWPYNPPGMIGEFSALALSAGLGLAAGVATGRWFAFARFVGRWPAAAAFALFFYVVLRVSDPFAGERYWLYAPPECDFDIRFPRRATVIASETNVAGGAALRVERAIYTDIGLALTLSAECSGHGAATGGGERAGLRATAASTLRRIAQNTGLKVHSVDEALAELGGPSRARRFRPRQPKQPDPAPDRSSRGDRPALGACPLDVVDRARCRIRSGSGAAFHEWFPSAWAAAEPMKNGGSSFWTTRRFFITVPAWRRGASGSGRG